MMMGVDASGPPGSGASLFWWLISVFSGYNLDMETKAMWAEIIEKAGFERQYGISGDWSFVTKKISSLPWQWYVKDSSVIGMSIDASTNLVKLLFVHNPSSDRPSISARLIRPNDHVEAECVVDALSDPGLSPLCVGIPWAADLAESIILDS